MKVKAITPDEFFAAADEREGDLRALDALIAENAPEAERSLFESMSITMLAYGNYHYKYASGREGDWPVIGLANQKNYISLYIYALKGGKYLPEIYGDTLGRADIGKSCVRFKKLTDLNLHEVKKLIRDSAKWYEKNRNTVVTNQHDSRDFN